MLNTKIAIEGTIMTIVVDLAQEAGESASGKSITIATTQGNMPVVYGDDVITVGLNVYRRKPKTEAGRAPRS